MNVPKLTYRPFQRSDLAGILQLWESDSGWGAISVSDFDEWYVDTPHGESIISVAVDDRGEVYGQEVFFPMRTVVDGQVVRSLHLSAPILHPTLRGQQLRDSDHASIKLYFSAMEEAERRGYDLVYATPQRAWIPFFRWANRAGLSNYMVKTYGCAGRPLIGTGSSVDRAREFSLSQASDFGLQYDELWERARAAWPISCGNVRDSRWVNWRNGDHVVLEARDASGGLAGYAALRGDGLIVDVLSRELHELTPVIDGAIAWIRESAGNAGLPVPEQVKVMRHPVLEPAIEALGFADVDFEFGFACSTLGDTVDREKIEPDKWFVMPLY